VNEIETPWQGINVPNGADFRIPAGSLRIELVDGEPTMSVGPVEIRTDLWPHWIEVAKAALSRARTANALNPGLGCGRDAEFQALLEQELQECLIACAAAAFALEAFAYSVQYHDSGAPIVAASTSGWMHQVFLRAFRMPNEQSRAVRSSLREVFKWRNRAVHPSAEFAEPITHPQFFAGMEPRYIWFRVENAETVVRFARDLIYSLLHQARPGVPGLTAWCEAMIGRETLWQPIRDGVEDPAPGTPISDAPS
jgi:hypothetical protein